MAAAIGLSPKQLANTLTRIHLDAPVRGRQGKRRRLAPDVVSRLDIVAKLGALGVPAAEAYRLSGEITDSAGLPIGAGIELRYDREEHWRDLNSRLRDAAERVVARRRGRPPARAGRLR